MKDYWLTKMTMILLTLLSPDYWIDGRVSMGYPADYTGVRIDRTTHRRLKRLKEKDESFDSVLNRLLDLEDKYSEKVESFEYAYVCNGISKVFKVIFDEKVTIEYFNPKSNEFVMDIRAWQSVDALSEEELDSFVRFIIKDSSLWLLYDMEKEIQFNDIHIVRV